MSFLYLHKFWEQDFCQSQIYNSNCEIVAVINCSVIVLTMANSVGLKAESLFNVESM